MVNIRRASLKDFGKIFEYGSRKHPESAYAHIPLDKKAFRETVFSIISNPKMGVIFVSEDQFGVQGFIIGMVDSYPFSRKKYATDMLFIADKGGAKLFQKFEQWALEKGVADITMGISSGMGDAEMIGKFYELSGYKKMGGIYTKFMGVSQ